MKNAPHVPGVPTPYSMHIHPYPTRFHGPIYTRPAFGFPVIARPQEVFTPGYDISRNAPRVPVSGLGSTPGAQAGGSSLWHTGDGVFRPGGYGGGVFDGNISGLGSLGHVRPRAVRGLGDDGADYPWKTYSAKTKQLQEATNISLEKAGLCPLVVDGKLGGATCGARNHLSVNSEKYFGQAMAFNNPSACDSHIDELVRPTPKAQGCGTTSKPMPAPSAALPVYESGMSSSTKRTLGFAVGGLLAIGAIVVMRRKR